jgi:NDP-sugar pyrophosphorylase family protein
MIENKIEAIPIVDTEHRVSDIFIWSNLFDGSKRHVEKIDVPVVIMAGGKGERLDPFTKIFPKALIPVGEKPIVEVIMDRFSQCGVKEFYLSVNYKGAMIKSYFENTKLPYDVAFIWEKEFLGTAGSLSLLGEGFPSTFFVSNCDILVDADYTDILRFHKKNENDLTMIGSFRHHVIPYGVIEFSTNGAVKEISEKPEYDFSVNTGVYVMEKTILAYIPKDKLFHVTQLIQELLKGDKRVGVYPVSEKSYIDIGQWEKYRENVRRFLS